MPQRSQSSLPSSWWIDGAVRLPLMLSSSLMRCLTSCSTDRQAAAALIADLLGRSRGNVARCQVAVTGIHPLQKEVAIGFGDLVRRTTVAALLRHPHAAVVAQRLRH